MGLSLRKLGEKYPQKFALLFDKIAHFHEIRYNVSGKHLLYCNFDTFLHVYLRHVKELKVDNQFGDRDKFQLKEENVMDVMGHVMRCKTNRLSGSYTSSDWEKASKYTTSYCSLAKSICNTSACTLHN
jgi:hypothetical protein